MARYAEAADVQALVAIQIARFNATSQPTLTQVETWLDQQSDWVDRTLRWRYTVPITDADDKSALNPILAALVAALAWETIGSHNGEMLGIAAQLRRNALQSLAYQSSGANAGRSFIVLPNSGLSDSGEASLSIPEHSFTDPDDCDSNPRFFEIGMDW